MFNHKETGLYQDQSTLLFQFNNKNKLIIAGVFLALGLTIRWAIPEIAKKMAGISDTVDQTTLKVTERKVNSPTLNSEGCK